MLRRQGIGFEISKCTTSLQAHSETKQKKRSDGKRVTTSMLWNVLLQGKGGLKLLWAFKRIKEEVDQNKQTNKQKCSLRRGAARYLLLLMPRSSASLSLRTPLPPATQPFFMAICDKLKEAEEEQMKRSSSRVFFLVCFFPSGPAREKRGASEENWNFKMVLIVCIFRHSCVSLPALTSPPRLPLFISITPAITSEERTEREAALWCDSAVLKK